MYQFKYSNDELDIGEDLICFLNKDHTRDEVIATCLYCQQIKEVDICTITCECELTSNSYPYFSNFSITRLVFSLVKWM